MFYDDGGPNANYGNNKDLTMTFMPSSPGAKIQVVFQSFETENNYDFLYVYDGTSTSAPQIGNQHSGNDSPGTVTATNAAGAITFRFTSDSSVTREGWSAQVHCLGLPLEVVAYAANDTILINQTNTLNASATGGTENYTYSWSPATNLNDATAQNPLFTPTEAGDFTYTVTVSDGNETVTASVSFTVIDNTDVNEIAAQNVKVYPNPASSVINIEGIDNYNNLDVKIVNVQGQVVKEVPNTLEINVSDINTGVYFIKIDLDGQQSIQKIVIK
jgi:hypothetical protein